MRVKAKGRKRGGRGHERSRYKGWSEQGRNTLLVIRLLP